MTTLSAPPVNRLVRIANDAIHMNWSDLLPDEIDWIDGRMNRLIHALVSKYGISRDEAARQVVEFVERQPRQVPR